MPWPTEGKHVWTREDEIAAYALYCITPDDKLNASNETVKRVAQIQGISIGSMVRKLINIRDLYANDLQPLQTRSHASNQNKRIYAEFKNDWDSLSKEAERITNLTIFSRQPIHGVFINGEPISIS